MDSVHFGLEDALRDSRNEANNLRQEVYNLKDKIASKNSDVVRLNEVISQKDADVENLRKQVQQLNDKLATIKSDMRLHETRFADILTNCQNIYSHTGKDTKYGDVIRSYVEDILEDNEYEFVNYAEGLGDFFEMRRASVKEAVTSKPAVRDKISGKFICKGTYVSPLNDAPIDSKINLSAG